jgi:hypothetical protein
MGDTKKRLKGTAALSIAAAATVWGAAAHATTSPYQPTEVPAQDGPQATASFTEYTDRLDVSYHPGFDAAFSFPGGSPGARVVFVEDEKNQILRAFIWDSSGKREQDFEGVSEIISGSEQFTTVTDARAIFGYRVIGRGRFVTLFATDKDGGVHVQVAEQQGQGS